MSLRIGILTAGGPCPTIHPLIRADFTFGYDTAVSMVTEGVDRLRSTAESHHRVMVVEVMGRHTGWIAAYGGIAGGARAPLRPRPPFPILWVRGFIKRRGG